MRRYIFAVIATFSLIGCASTTKPDTSKSAALQDKPAETQSARSDSNTKPGSTTQPDASASKLAEQAQLAMQLGKESVYFDFDRAEVKPEFQKVVKKHEDFLFANKSDIVTLAGNCDERGSSEYNLSLGDRRSQSVSRQLQILGLPKQRIRLVSYGEEKPRLTCHEEHCWQENRRVDFIHKLD